MDRTTQRLLLGLGWMLIWSTLVVVLSWTFAGSHPHRGVRPSKKSIQAGITRVTVGQPRFQGTSIAMDTRNLIWRMDERKLW